LVKYQCKLVFAVRREDILEKMALLEDKKTLRASVHAVRGATLWRWYIPAARLPVWCVLW